MTKLKQAMAIAIALMASIMICVTWPNESATGWMVALVGWLEVINYQRTHEK